jgi:hypothetical protein
MANEQRNRAELEDLELPAEIRAMFASYREALPDPEPGANFMPQLWNRIDSQRNVTFSFGRLAKQFVSVSVASCLAMSILFLTPVHQMSPIYGATYLDVLDADHPDDLPDTDLTHSIEFETCGAISMTLGSIRVQTRNQPDNFQSDSVRISS